MRHWGPGRSLIAVVAIVTIVSPALVDYNESHIFNPDWSGHAKFHTAHTILQGGVLGALALGYLYPARGSNLASLRAAWFAAAYWIAQAGSILLPGTTFADPEFADRLPTVGNLTLTQPVLDAVLVCIVAAGYLLESRRLRGANPSAAAAKHREANPAA